MEEPENEPASEAVASSQPPTAISNPRRKWLLGASVAVTLVAIFNLTVRAPVATALAKEDRNHVAGVHVYRSWLVHPRDITVNLVTVGVAPCYTHIDSKFTMTRPNQTQVGQRCPRTTRRRPVRLSGLARSSPHSR